MSQIIQIFVHKENTVNFSQIKLNSMNSINSMSGVDIANIKRPTSAMTDSGLSMRTSQVSTHLKNVNNLDQHTKTNEYRNLQNNLLQEQNTLYGSNKTANLPSRPLSANVFFPI